MRAKVENMHFGVGLRHAGCSCQARPFIGSSGGCCCSCEASLKQANHASICPHCLFTCHAAAAQSNKITLSLGLGRVACMGRTKPKPKPTVARKTGGLGPAESNQSNPYDSGLVACWTS